MGIPGNIPQELSQQLVPGIDLFHLEDDPRRFHEKTEFEMIEDVKDSRRFRRKKENLDAITRELC